MTKPEPWLRIRANGTPVPQGSKKAWADPKAPNGVRMVEDQGERHASWRREVTAAAVEALWKAGVNEPTGDPLTVLLTFKVVRGVGMYGTGRNACVLKLAAPPYPKQKPDLDKLVRSVFDSLTDARVWIDDSQVVAFTARKRFIDRFGEEPPGVAITIGFMPQSGDLS